MLYATVRQRKIHVKNPVTVIQNGIGVDQLILDMDDEWKQMDSIVCVFTNGEVAKEMLHTFGEPVQVPWECLKETGLLSVSCTGYVGSEKVMTTMLPDSFWNVVQNGPVTGDTPMEPTPTLYEQVLAAAGAANAAATQATNVSAQLMQDKENGVFDGENGITPTLTVGTVLTGASGSEAQVTQTGTPTDVVLNFVIPRGLQGVQGKEGPTGPIGPVGPIGPAGPEGKGVVSVELAGGAYDPNTGVNTSIYEMTFTDGSTFQFSVRDGRPGIQGADGEDGSNGGYYVPTITDEGLLTWTYDTPGGLVLPVPAYNIKGEPGASGVYYGSTEPTDESVMVWVKPDGEANRTETWTFTLEDGTIVTKEVYVK